MLCKDGFFIDESVRQMQYWGNRRGTLCSRFLPIRFLSHASDNACCSLKRQEKLWLSSFSSHVKKYILKENSYQSCTDLTLSILECITSLIRENTWDDGDDIDGDVDDSEPAWNQYHFRSLESLSKEKDICAGQLNGNISNGTQSAANLGNVIISLCKIVLRDCSFITS